MREMVRLSALLILAFSFHRFTTLPLLAEDKILTVWAMGEEGIRISSMTRLFEQENPGVRVITQSIPWGAAHEKLLTSVVGGLPPDVCQLGTTWVTEFATLKSLEPLESYVKKSTVIKRDKFFEGSWKTGIVNGGLYGIPWYVDVRVLFYRKDILKEVGFSHPPQTWDEFKKVCKLLARPRKGMQSDHYGIALPVKGWGDFVPFIWQNEADLFHPTSPEYKESLKYYISFFKENLAPSKGSIDTDLYHAFRTGFYPMFVSGPWMVELLAKELPELKGKWAVAMMPGKKKRTSFVGGSDFVIFKDSKQKELAWKFIEFMSQPHNQLEWHKILKSLPAVKKAWEDPLLKGHPMLKVFGEQMQDTNSPPTIPEWEQITMMCENYIEAMILNPALTDEDIAKTLAAMEADINDIVSKSKTQKTGLKKFLIISFLILFALPVSVSVFFLYRRRKTQGPGQSFISVNLQSLKTTFVHSIPGYVFTLPAVLVLLMFLFVPIVVSFLISLTDWDIYGLADKSAVGFVGLANYKAVLSDALFWKSLVNTLFFTGAGVPLTIILSLACATVMNEKFVRFKTFFRTSYFVPVISTIVAVAVIWRWLYNYEFGLLNWFLEVLSVKKIGWLTDANYALASLILMAAWKNFGYNMIIFLAGLQNIPETLYESARIDGANTWQLFRHVTLPGLRPTMVFVTIMSTIGYLQFFAEPYVMTMGGPTNSTMSIVLHMYYQGFKFFKLGYASALAYVLFGIIFIFTLVQIKLRKSGFEVE